MDWRLIGERIREDRGRLRLTQNAYAKRLGISQTQVSQIELGKLKRPGPDVMTAIRSRLPSADGGSGTEPATVSSPAPEEKPLPHEITALAFRLKTIRDKHGAESEEWKWLCGNIEMFERAPPRHAAVTPTATKTQRRGRRR